MRKISSWNWKILLIVLAFLAVFTAGFFVGFMGNFFTHKKFVAVIAEKQLPISTCATIEELLNKELLRFDEKSTDYTIHISRANIYANLADDGCSENKDKYNDLALHEIEIARALSDDKMDDYNAVYVIRLYDKLNLRDKAGDLIDKVKKLKDPANDFYLEAKRIFGE